MYVFLEYTSTKMESRLALNDLHSTVSLSVGYSIHLFPVVHESTYSFPPPFLSSCRMNILLCDCTMSTDICPYGLYRFDQKAYCSAQLTTARPEEVKFNRSQLSSASSVKRTQISKNFLHTFHYHREKAIPPALLLNDGSERDVVSHVMWLAFGSTEPYIPYRFVRF